MDVREYSFFESGVPRLRKEDLTTEFIKEEEMKTVCHMMIYTADIQEGGGGGGDLRGNLTFQCVCQRLEFKKYQ